MDPNEIWNLINASPEIRDAILGAYTQASGFERDKLKQQKLLTREGEAGATNRARISANAQLAAAKMQHKAAMARLERLEIPQMEINRLDVEGRLRIAEMAHRLNEQTLGVDVVKTMTELGSQPESWLKTANFARGVSQTQVPQFLESLAKSEYMAPFVSGVAGAPGANSLGNVMAQLGVGTAPATATAQGTTANGMNMDQINSYIDQVGQNPHQYDIGGLTSDELSMFSGALKSRGFSPQTWSDFNKRSKPGQGSYSAA